MPSTLRLPSPLALPRRRRRNGSGRSRRTHRVNGQPVRRPRLPAVVPFDRVQHHGQARGAGSASTSSASARSSSRGSVSATPARSRPATERRSPSRRCTAAVRPATATLTRCCRSTDPAAVAGGGDQHLADVQPSSCSSRPRSSRHAATASGGQPVGLVEDHDGHRVMPGERREVVLGAAGRRRTSAGRSPRRTRRPARAPGRPRRGARPAASRSRAGPAAPGPSRRSPSRLASRASTWCRAPTASQSSSADAGSGPPHGRRRGRGRRAAGADRRDVGTDQVVEQAGLPAPGGAGERDDGVAAGDRGPLARSASPPAAPAPPAPGPARAAPASSASPRAAPRRRMSSAEHGRRHAWRPSSTGSSRRLHCSPRRAKDACACPGSDRHGLRAPRRTGPARRHTARRSGAAAPRRALVASVAHRLVAEDALEQPLGEHRRPSGDADLGPGQAHRSG